MNVKTDSTNPFPPGNGTANAALGKAAASTHGAIDTAAVAVDEAARKVMPAIERAAQMAHQTVNRVSDAAGPTAGWLSEKGGNLQESRRKAFADANQYVSAHPWKSLGFALAAGFIISRLIR